MDLHSPLEWPPNIPRKRARKTGAFKSDNQPVTVISALGRLDEELGRHDARGIEVSAHFGQTKGFNVARTWNRASGDPGVSVRYDIGKTPYTLPCDTYDDLAQNIAAIANHLAAVRAMERYGVATTAQVMGAFAALPAPKPVRKWFEVLGVAESSPESAVVAVYRALAKERHPDSGGSTDDMTELNGAMEEFKASRKVAR